MSEPDELVNVVFALSGSLTFMYEPVNIPKIGGMRLFCIFLKCTTDKTPMKKIQLPA